MKRICHTWSRDRHFSPSLPPGDKYLNLGSPKKRSSGRNLGEHRSVRRSGTKSRGTALLVFRFRMRRFRWTEVLTIFVGKMSSLGDQIQSAVSNNYNSCQFLQLEERTFNSLMGCFLLWSVQYLTPFQCFFCLSCLVKYLTKQPLQYLRYIRVLRKRR